MLIADPTITFINGRTARVSWTGTPNKTVRIYVNGLQALASLRPTEADVSVQLSLPDPFVLEIHEADEDEDVVPISLPLTHKPTIWWTSKPGAAQYRIYHQAAGEAERLLTAMPHADGRLHHELRSTRDLSRAGEQWAWLRVEAADAGGTESVREPWPLFTAALPKKITSVTIGGSAGVFSFTLGVAS